VARILPARLGQEHLWLTRLVDQVAQVNPEKFAVYAFSIADSRKFSEESRIAAI
jgi:hypothetical protein